MDVAWQQCIDPGCGGRFPLTEALHGCSACGGLLDVRYDKGHATNDRSGTRLVPSLQR